MIKIKLLNNELMTNGGKKFIITEKDGEFYVLFFSINETHYDIFEIINKEDSGSKFIGAGFIGRNICYDSISCLEKLGYDRPEDEELGEKILDFIKNEVKKK